MSIVFSVHGQPVPQGSLRAFVRDGRPIVTYGSAGSLGAWRQSIASCASDAMGATPMLMGPVSVTLAFKLRRPRGHQGAHGILPRFADALPITRPDADKLARAGLDGMTGVVYADDSQVVELRVSKSYAERPGLLVEIHPL